MSAHPPVFCRPATAADEDALVTLYPQFLATQFALADLGPQNDAFDVRAYVRARLANPAMAVFVATRGADIVGFCDWSVSTPGPGFCWKRTLRDAVVGRHPRAALRAVAQRLQQGRPNSYLAGRPAGYLHNIFVLPEARGQQAGDRLLEAGLAWVRAQGATVIETHVLADNHAAQRVFARHGMRPFSLLLRWLPDDARAAHDNARAPWPPQRPAR